jgi:hypothetical protein
VVVSVEIINLARSFALLILGSPMIYRILVRRVILALSIVGAMGSSLAQAATPPSVAVERQKGPIGLAQLIAEYDRELKSGPSPELRASLDAICQQRDCHASRLYWYTDLAQAKIAAQKSGKPILSLRLLGNLDEELSCANSRFFRLALYANQAVGNQLRDRFILHWSSERPVPKVTIDFGNGRKLERTVTGNSVHYVLDTQGQPIEAIPGLYGPQAFAAQLTQAETFFKVFQQLPAAQQPAALRQYHYDRFAQVQQQWSRELTTVTMKDTPALLALPPQPPTRSTPSAAIAGRIAMTKSAVELPLVQLTTPLGENRQTLTQITDESAWKVLADRDQSRSKLDANSLALMAQKVSPNASRPLAIVAGQFERNMALDTVRNEYLLHSQLHQWFSEQETMATFEQLNRRVYNSLFLTPASDPWLGLRPGDAFAAIEGDGVLQN